MANYKPVKIMFDLDDPYHLGLYKYLKRQTNGSSYVRTLLHQDLNEGKRDTHSPPSLKEYPIVNVQDEVVIEEQKVIKTKSVMKTVEDTVTVAQPNSEFDFNSLI
jgi:hypothetical protein